MKTQPVLGIEVNLNLIPNSDHPYAGKTLWELCEDVIIAIEGSPGNYYQNTWKIRTKYLAEISGNKNYKEACGTAFCRAGWMTNLLCATGANTPNSGGVATNLLLRAGISNEDINNLFVPHGNIIAYEQYGGLEYAKIGTDGMRLFMKQHEAKLKAYTITRQDRINP